MGIRIALSSRLSPVMLQSRPADRSTGSGNIRGGPNEGNHPRGIKVRLVDGRVGRVQRMVAEAEATAGSEGREVLGKNYSCYNLSPLPPSNIVMFEKKRKGIVILLGLALGTSSLLTRPPRKER
ncbi:hypothetical protein BT96DRAFT_1015806 [Gymnopus androsaceus JB14]|uniref:Uncharacterized protein n=1 Tax=Gymnopus androsaceus JB14 TaxID=1447944 RepID=A0A6A4I6X0_9AGAR|nr:hypothetical protein BT96DRAFT_1015806 [Gymnopus androsaceus JB14]